MINRKIKYMLLLIFSTSFLVKCFDTNASERKKRNDDNKTALLELIGLSWGSKEIGAVVDNKDGTLNYTYQLLQTNSWLGNKVISQKTILIRRCLIGQVYRSAQNDCQGTGTKDTLWGASQLQWCPTNDRSCEKDGKADPTVSPAAKACATDTFAGKKWRLRSKDEGLRVLFSPSVTNDWTKIGFVSGNVWTLESNDNEKVFSAIAFESSLAYKNEAINILCTGEI
ncbi:MAG TPA: hypothetical protein PKC66_21240 [Leptospiraceae bacterium]|nr:hypothetical protein [Leptospiraceae bacterium]HMX34772.1 hypothetical protein [Leptospiraceae bacterium]HMY32755.1 hypothetical protein [Leptospiraceae bacterium]HNA05795.1 hypothetical protein [Leptospiraceae bacterium]HNB97149.1 hypothetical protein [Leptospiraceae bacterium]